MTKGLSGALAITRTGDASRATSAPAPPSKALLGMLIGSCPLPDLSRSIKAWLVIMEPPWSEFPLWAGFRHRGGVDRADRPIGQLIHASQHFNGRHSGEA